MSFLKRIFRKGTKDTLDFQSLSDSDLLQFAEEVSAVRHAIECSFPSETEQSEVHALLGKRTKSMLTQLALISYSKGDVEKLRSAVGQSHPHFWMDEISPIFSTTEEAIKWATSLSKQ